MKPLRFIPLAIIASALPVVSQEKTLSRSFIPTSLEVPAFSPPAPVEPKRLPTIRIDASTKLPSCSGKTLTLQRGAASTLPDLPPSLPPEPIKAARELTSAELASLAYQRRHQLNLGATVFDHKISQIHWTDQETGIFYQALCGFDVGLLEGIGTFVRDHENYSVFLTHSDIDTTSPRLGRGLLQIPKIHPDQILVTQGNPKDPVANRLPELLRDLLTTERKRLITFQAARLEHQQAAAAWQKAHPAIPRDETILLRPHRGSRYLADPQPEKKEVAR